MLRSRPSRFRSCGKEFRLRLNTTNVHTPTMTLKNAALLALVGTILMTALMVWNFVFTFLNVLRGLVPAVMVFESFIYAFGCFSVMVFFFVFHRTQSWFEREFIFPWTALAGVPHSAKRFCWEFGCPEWFRSAGAFQRCGRRRVLRFALREGANEWF